MMTRKNSEDQQLRHSRRWLNTPLKRCVNERRRHGACTVEEVTTDLNDRLSPALPACGQREKFSAHRAHSLTASLLGVCLATITRSLDAAQLPTLEEAI